jgi:hypothetical protein
VRKRAAGCRFSKASASFLKKSSKKLSFYAGPRQHMSQIPTLAQKFFGSCFQKTTSSFTFQGLPMPVPFSPHISPPLAAPKNFRP